MGLTMKNFNILGIHRKVWLLQGKLMKNWYEVGGLPKKRGLLLIAHKRAFLGTQSEAFSESTKVKYRGVCLPTCFSCNWCRMKIASLVPWPCIKTNYILSISTWDLITASRTLSMIFITWCMYFITYLPW